MVKNLLHKKSNLIILKEALGIYESVKLKELPSEAELSKITFSSQFEKKMNRLISKQRKPLYYVFDTAGKRIASIAIVIAIALSGIVFSVQAIREPVINFIIETYQKFSAVFFKDEEVSDSSDAFIMEYMIPTYLPKGYSLKHETDLILQFTCEYDNGVGDIIIYHQRVKDDSALKIDTEGIETENIIIGEHYGIYYENKGTKNIIWADSAYQYSISGNISKEELIEISQSLKETKK